MYWTSRDVLMISHWCTYDIHRCTHGIPDMHHGIPQCTEHPLMYLWYPPPPPPPDVLMVFPWCTEHPRCIHMIYSRCIHDIPPMYWTAPDLYSWYPPDVLMVSPRCTEHTLYSVIRPSNMSLNQIWSYLKKKTGLWANQVRGFSIIMLLLTELEVHTRRYLFWHSEQIFPVWTENSVNKSFIVYIPKWNSMRYKLYWVRAFFTVLVRSSVYTPVRTPMYGLPLSQSDQRIRCVFQSVYNKWHLRAGGHSFAFQQGCRIINIWRFIKLWTAATLAFIATVCPIKVHKFEIKIFVLKTDPQ